MILSNDDVKKGIAIQAKIDSEKYDKVSTGLEKANSILQGLSSGQCEIRDVLGTVLSDMSTSEAKSMYGIELKKKVWDLDANERLVLCSTLYTLLSTYGHNSELQRKYYFNIEKGLGINDRNKDFDLNSLSMVDSYSDRLVILKCVCEFLFIEDESFDFIYMKNAYSWIYGFAPVKDIVGTCVNINEEYSILGLEGIVDKHLCIDQSGGVSDEQYDHNVNDVIEKTNEEPVNDFQQLYSIVHNHTDSGNMGKVIEMDRDDFYATFSRYIKNLSYDSIIAINKISDGYLIFSIHAVYAPIDTFWGKKYACLPYSTIVYSEIFTESGKKKGTRKLSIPYFDSALAEKKVVSLDDKELVEEELQMLLHEVDDSNCFYADNDRYINIDEEFTHNQWVCIMSLLVYMLRKENYSLLYAYVYSELWSIKDAWNEVYEEEYTEDSFYSKLNEFYANIPDVSKHEVSFQLLRAVIELVVLSNRFAGKAKGYMNSSLEKMVKAFSNADVETEIFNKLIKDTEESKIDYKKLYFYFYNLDTDVKGYSELKKDFDIELNNLLKTKPLLMLPYEYHALVDPQKGKITDYYAKIVDNISINCLINKEKIPKGVELSKEYIKNILSGNTWIQIIEISNGTTKSGNEIVWATYEDKSSRSPYSGDLWIAAKNNWIRTSISCCIRDGSEEVDSIEKIIKDNMNELIEYIISNN